MFPDYLEMCKLWTSVAGLCNTFQIPCRASWYVILYQGLNPWYGQPPQAKDFHPKVARLSPSPIDPVDKVVWEPMEALNQLDGVTADFIMEDDSDDAPPSLNSASSTGSRTPPTLCSPLSFRQLRTVPKKTNNGARAMTQWEFRVGELMLMG